MNIKIAIAVYEAACTAAATLLGFGFALQAFGILPAAIHAAVNQTAGC